MFHISREPSVQQTYFSLNGKMAMLKTQSYYLSPTWNIWSLSLSCVVVERQNNFDLSTIFFITHKFHIILFCNIF
jgi:hypothetical protein